MTGHCEHCIDGCQFHKHSDCHARCCREHWSVRAKWDDGHCPACAERTRIVEAIQVKREAVAAKRGRALSPEWDIGMATAAAVARGVS